LDVSEEESDEELDADDEEYVGPGGGSGRRRGRFGAKFRGGNRRMLRGVRIRGSGRSWDRGSTRGLSKVGPKRRGGRGRGGLGRPEDIEKAQRLEAEMAAAVAAMDQSPDMESSAKSPGTEQVTGRSVASRIFEKQEGQVEDLDSEIGSRKKVKVYGKSNLKTKLTLMKDVEEKVGDVIETKQTPEKTGTLPIPEKKVPVKSPVRKHSTDITQQPQPSAVSPSTVTSTEASKIDGRKNYPKRENRKPPAHLAEALGPALFSTPDIIRRVSIGNEQRTNTVASEMSAAEVKKEESSSSPPSERGSQVNVQESTRTPSGQQEGKFSLDMFLFVVATPATVIWSFLY